uniref:Caspase family p20 domain-containing protein n=1 Tax=Branchiostoma floridae TaxID=7739 RepID=C3YZ38_BRAFL|eukprot:XP_002598534.1 hypothetical protein BRAFLDRAFT_66918 [Branchiostoma floridae]
MWRQHVMTEQIFREDKERETYRDVREGEKRGKLPFNRSKVLFVGDTWQGKTSLKKRLTGQEFDPHEGRTEGIQTKMVETQEVDQTWATRHHNESDYSRSLAWFVAQRSKKRPKKGATKDLGSLMKTASFYFVLSFLAVTALEFGSRVGYAVASLLLTSTIFMMHLNSDFYHVTRIASAIAVNSVFIGVMKNGVEDLYQSIGPILSMGPFSLQGFVFCVTVLVDAMKSITTLPRHTAELPTYRERHAMLRAQGILDGDFLAEVLNEVKPDHADVLTTLLVSHDFLCPLPQHPADKKSPLMKQRYLVPPMLPRYETDQPGGLFEKHHDDDNVEYYIDFDSFEPSPVFYRLVAKLVCETDFKIRARGAPFVFKDRACFQLHRLFYFTLELVRASTDQHLIQITVKKTSSTAADGQLIKELHGKLEMIRQRDFPCLTYTMGPRCPHPPPHLDHSTEPGAVHVVEVVESGEEFPDSTQPLKLLCRDREVVVDMSVPTQERSFQPTASAYAGRCRHSQPSTIVIQETAPPSDLLPKPDEHGLYDVKRWLQVAQDPESAFDKGECYPMWKRPRGDALIINNRDFVTMATRHGTDVDAENLERLFEALYFTTERWNNLRAPVMKLVLEDFAQRSHAQSQCCLVAILSHGGDEGVYSTDEQLLSHADILSKFDGNNCPDLSSKPKVFFMQACRGTDKDRGSPATDSGETFRKHETARTSPDTHRTFSTRVPNLTDVYLAYSTTPGHVSWRDCEGGSWFIQVLVSVFLKYAATKDINQLMTKVNHEVSRKFESDKHDKQMPAPVNMLTKDLFFCSGWHR